MSEISLQNAALTPFIFSNLAVRGAIVQVTDGWRNWLSHRPYPETVQVMLGQAMAAAPLMASTLKFEGKLSLQAEGDGAVPMLVVQANHQLEMRGMARWKGEIGGAANPALFGKGRLGIIIEPSGEGSRYEGIVPLSGETLAACLEGYFERSEQLETQLFLSANAQALGGLILQRMPAEDCVDEDAWPRLHALLQTLSDDELLRLPPEEILLRLFHDEGLELFPSRPVSLACRCSHGKTSELLLNMGEEEVRSIMLEQGQVEMECGFCGQRYLYDSAAVDQLFEAQNSAPPTDSRH